MKESIRLFGVAAVVASTVVLSAAGASAVRPSKEPFEEVITQTVTSLCDFPIAVTFVISGTSTTFPGSTEGNDRVVIHQTAQDTFTANGTTLVGEPYTATATLQFSNFEVVSAVVVGVIEKVRLPDGSTFMGAGWTDLLTSTTDIIVVPDHGVAKGQDAFCAALSG